MIAPAVARRISKSIGSLVSQREKNPGSLFVISGPSGCGKTTLEQKLMASGLGLCASVSMTTRAPRKGERNRRDYIFVSERQFRQGIANKKFLEYANVFGNYYGTPKDFALYSIKRGQDVLLSIDVQGAAQVKKNYRNAVLIFILPPSFNELKKRLVSRSSDSAKEIARRLRVAEKELRASRIYDYLVVNDKVDRAAGEITAIIRSVRSRYR